MKKSLSFLAIILLLISNTQARISETDALNKYHQANIAYQKLNYESSIKLYNELIDNNYKSEEIYFNLGNSYFKAGNFSKAILNYERAKKIEPEDEDTNFNLKIASLKVVDKIETAPQIFYKRWLNTAATSFSADAWTILFVILLWFLFASAALYVVSHTVSGKKIAFFSLLLFIIVSFSSGLMMIKSHVMTNVDKQAIIMASSVYVKSSPDEKGNDLYILHEGTKAEVLDEIGDWRKIRLANGSIGWMKASEMETI